MQPYDYSSALQTPSIVDSFNKGLGIGIARDNALIAQQAQQQAIAQQQAAMEAEQRRQQMIAEFQAKANPTGADYGRLIVADPKNSEAFKRAFEATSQAQRDNAFSDASQLFAAVNVGNLDVANSFLDERIQAAENSGDAKSARQYSTVKQLMAIDPKQAKLVAASVMHGIDPEKATKVIDSANKLVLAPIEQRQKEAEATSAESKSRVDAATEQTQIDKAAADLGLTKAQRNQALAAAGKANAETKKIAFELEAAKADAKSGVLPPEKRFDFETKLRSEYSKETKNFQDVDEAFKRIKAAENTGAGDISLIYSYMKMLDPGSVVREGEFATAQNSAGIPTAVMNVYNKALNGERLSPSQRKMFSGQAGKLYNAALEKEQDVRKTLAPIAKKYGLDTANIFSVSAPTAASTATPSAPTGDEINNLIKKYGG